MAKRRKRNQNNDLDAAKRERELAVAALDQIGRARIGTGPLALIAQDGELIELPECVVDLLKECLQCIACGDAVRIVPLRTELSTFEAAALLGVSRPFLIKELDAGKLRCRLVGSHRRISLAEVLRYKQAIDSRRHEALDELSQQAQMLGMGY